MAKPDYERLNGALADALAACANGDRKAFEKVYQLTASKFLALLTRQLGDPETARDVAQKAYVSIWRNAGKFDPAKGKAFTWMLVIMRNRGLDHLRSLARAPETEEIAHTLADPADQPEDQARLKAAGRLVARHLAELPEHVSRAISLNVVYGMSCSEIGHQLDVSPNTVKGWVRRGLKRLNTEMPASSLSAIL